MNLLKIMSLALFFALCLIGITTTFAQSRATNLTEEQKEEIKKNLEAYTAALHLSEAQKLKFEEITLLSQVFLTCETLRSGLFDLLLSFFIKQQIKKKSERQ